MKTTEEKDFQTQANEYAKTAIENIRQMVFALDHSDECSGEQCCPDCNGAGYIGPSETRMLNPECATCKGAGELPCTEGHDSDDPESWHDRDRARQRIEEDALSVEVRSDWHTPGDENAAKPSEYCILLTTGGPAARIVGDLDDYGQPTRARFEYQDWFKPWTEVISDSADYAAMLQYAQQFYFGCD